MSHRKALKALKIVWNMPQKLVSFTYDMVVITVSSHRHDDTYLGIIHGPHYTTHINERLHCGFNTTRYTIQMQTFEVEIKALLGDEEKAHALRERMLQLDPTTTLTSKNTQLNHYFTGGNIEDVLNAVSDLLSPESAIVLADLAIKAKDFSLRTRQKDEEVILVVKASVDDTTSSNGISRMEFEETVSVTLQELDQRLLDAGFLYQAKWSREREEYLCRGANVCLDKNAGYGYLAEFEKVIGDQTDVEQTRDELRQLMRDLEVDELEQARLERMFAHYNANWSQYYGTNRIFIIE